MTLLFALLLLIGAGILAFSSGRTGVVEQRIANNEQQGIGAEEAAEAGLAYARSWLAEHVWRPGMSAPTPPSPRSAAGETFDIQLGLSPASSAICVRAHSVAREDPSLTATAEACFAQMGLFAASPATRMPPPLVSSGCWTTAPPAAELYVADPSPISIASGQSADEVCLPQGALEVSVWADQDADRILAATEKGASAPYRRARFQGCPQSHCAWNQVFDLPFEEAVALAEAADQVYSDEIPCEAPSTPGIYLIQMDEPIEPLDVSNGCSGGSGTASRTIGTPNEPILLIVPSDAGCPVFMDGIEIYGIVYFETPCGTQDWQGARIQGTIIWEGDAVPPSEGSVLVETDYGAGGELNAAFRVVTDAALIPGTWRDWQ